MELDVAVALGTNRVTRAIRNEMTIPLFSADFGFAPNMGKNFVHAPVFQIANGFLRSHRSSMRRRRRWREGGHISPCTDYEHAFARLRNPK
jgi:hypothetical protein